MTWKTYRKGGDGANRGTTWFADRDGDGDGRMDQGAGAETATVDAVSAADQLLGSTRRTTALTLEAALSRVRPLRRDVRDRFYGLDEDRDDDGGDVVAAAFDMMTLSRLSLRSAETLNGVVAAMVGVGRRAPDGHAPRSGH